MLTTPPRMTVAHLRDVLAFWEAVFQIKDMRSLATRLPYPSSIPWVYASWPTRTIGPRKTANASFFPG